VSSISRARAWTVSRWVRSIADLSISATVPTTRLSGFARQARQQVDIPHCLDRLLCTRAVPIIPILLTGRRAASSPVHPTDAIAAYCRRTTALPSSFRFGFAAKGGVSPLHGVVAHFFFSTPPTSERSGCLVSLRIGIGFSELTAKSAGDATLRGAPTPVVQPLFVRHYRRALDSAEAHSDLAPTARQIVQQTSDWLDLNWRNQRQESRRGSLIPPT
jgi:hypothetical protein